MYDDQYYYGGDSTYNITRQVIPGSYESCPQYSCIVVNYKIQVDVLDASYNTVATRERAKQIQITFTGLTQNSDVEEIADSVIGQSDLLPESRRDDLIKAIMDLQRNVCTCEGDPFQQKAKGQKQSAANLVVTMSAKEVDDLLHSSIEKIHWGKDDDIIKTLAKLAEIAEYESNLSAIVQHQPLMNTLVNKLKTFASSNLQACVYIIGIFEKMSYFSNYQEIIASYKIGAMTLSLFHVQFKLVSVAAKNLDKKGLETYMTAQNKLLKLIVSLLFNLADNASAMRKMVNKSIVEPLTQALQRKDADLVITSLRFLRRISNNTTTWADVGYEDIIQFLAKDVLLWRLDGRDGKTKAIQVLREAIELLYSFAFHEETLEEIKKWQIFKVLAPLTKTPEVCGPMIKLFYKISLQEGSNDAFRNEDLLNMLITATTSKSSEEKMLALVILVKISTDKECSETIANSPVFTTENLKGMFVQATEKKTPENRVLLKMIRNVADNQPKLIDGFDKEIVRACTRNAQNMESLCDIFAISSRAQMTSARAKFFTGVKEFVDLIMNILANRRALPQLHLECVMFVSSVVLYSEPAKNLGASIVDRIVDVFQWNSDDLDIQTQCLFTFYRFICHSASRNQLISHTEIVNMIIQHSASRNAVLSGIANSVLEGLVTFDKEWGAKIRRPRYMAFNQEWITAMKYK